MSNKQTFEELSAQVAEFVAERDWEQFHNPKNLSMALAVEAGELMEIFQWLTAEQAEPDNLSPDELQAIKNEVADVMIYTLRLAQVCDFDPLAAVAAKIEKNRLKYPIAEVKGKAKRG